VAPVTFWGRAFCVAFALVGIPLTLTVIADLGKIIASSVGALGERLKQQVGCVRRLTQLANAGNTQKNSPFALCVRRVVLISIFYVRFN